jgi:hypothetical protein
VRSKGISHIIENDRISVRYSHFVKRLRIRRRNVIGSLYGDLGNKRQQTFEGIK